MLGLFIGGVFIGGVCVCGVFIFLDNRIEYKYIDRIKYIDRQAPLLDKVIREEDKRIELLKIDLERALKGLKIDKTKIKDFMDKVDYEGKDIEDLINEFYGTKKKVKVEYDVNNFGSNNGFNRDVDVDSLLNDVSNINGVVSNSYDEGYDDGYSDSIDEDFWGDNNEDDFWE